MNPHFTYKEDDREGLETLQAISKADAFNKWMYETISPFLTGHILEIGSGIGNISKYFILDQHIITLSDIRNEYCRHLSNEYGNYNNVKDILQIDLVHPDFRNIYSEHLGKFDSLFALNVVEHIKDDHLAIANASSLIRKGGSIVILVPAFSSLYNSMDKGLHHYRRYSRKELITTLISANLQVDHTFYFNALGIGGWMMNGLLKKEVISSSQMNAFNSLVPLARMADIMMNKLAGLSVIAVGRVQ